MPYRYYLNKTMKTAKDFVKDFKPKSMIRYEDDEINFWYKERMNVLTVTIKREFLLDHETFDPSKYLGKNVDFIGETPTPDPGRRSFIYTVPSR